MEPKKNTCQRCGHTWTQRIEKNPVACPACKQVKWQTPAWSKEAKK